MAPAIYLAARNEVEDQAVANHESDSGQRGVKEAEDNKPPTDGSGAQLCSDEEDEPRGDVQDVVRGVYHEETKEHFVFGYSGNETENSAEKE